MEINSSNYTNSDWEWFDPDHDLWNESYEFETGIKCQSCYGTGMDKYEDADCMNCYGEGVVYGNV